MSASQPTAGELYDRMFQAFQEQKMEQAEAETAAIIAEMLNCSRLQAKLRRDDPLPDGLFEQGLQIIEKRLNNEPWQYIFERAYFRDLTLKVTPDVLIPRPETELLVDWCLQYLPENGALLDAGTGSGAIALSVATERQDASVTACDISDSALKIARYNAGYAAPGRVKFLHSDLLSAFKDEKFDIIAANLPYVTENEYTFLDKSVRDFEPKLALTGGDDGLDLIRKLIHQAPKHLNHRGAIILEMSPEQTGPIAELLAGELCWCAIEIIRDYTQRERFVAARLRDALIV